MEIKKTLSFEEQGLLVIASVNMLFLIVGNFLNQVAKRYSMQT